MTTLTTTNGLAFTSTGLEVYSDNEPTLEGWYNAGVDFKRFCDTHEAVEKLLWGAWLNYGKHKFGDGYAIGYDVVIAPELDNPTHAPKTIWQYEYTSANVPLHLWGLPGVSHRHYFDAVTRLRDKSNEEYGPATILAEHLANVSSNRWTVRQALAQLPPSGRQLQPPNEPLPGFVSDINHQLTVENHRLQRELEATRIVMTQADDNISEAVSLLEDVLPDLPEMAQSKVTQAMSYLRTITVRYELIDMIFKAIDYRREGNFSKMDEVMEQIDKMRSEVSDGTITVNGTEYDRAEWLESERV